MLKIKLAPVGKKNDRHYRIVVAEEHSKLTGKNIDILGHFHPRLSHSDPSRLVLDTSKLTHWQSRGAQPTDKVRHLWKTS